MNPFVATQTQAIIEGLRLLETFVTAPLGLYSDIKMLRQSLPFPEAKDLPREEVQKRRLAYSQMSDSPQTFALDAISSLGKSLDMINQLHGEAAAPEFGPGWIEQARRVLTRAKERVGADVRARIASRIQGLYVIVDPQATRGRPVAEVAEAALRGGAGVVQLRDKARDKGEVLPVAKEIRSLCERHDALFVMNDDAGLAVSSDAHGLHLGQTDLPVPEARRLLAPQQLVGRSNNSMEEAMDSQAQGVDYMAVGAVYATATMGKSDRPVVGLEAVSKIKGLIPHPLVAIGGINAQNIGDVVRAGADSVCMVSAVTLADDPESATRELVDLMRKAR